MGLRMSFPTDNQNVEISADVRNGVQIIPVVSFEIRLVFVCCFMSGHIDICYYVVICYFHPFGFIDSLC